MSLRKGFFIRPHKSLKPLSYFPLWWSYSLSGPTVLLKTFLWSFWSWAHFNLHKNLLPNASGKCWPSCPIISQLNLSNEFSNTSLCFDHRSHLTPSPFYRLKTLMSKPHFFNLVGLACNFLFLARKLCQTTQWVYKLPDTGHTKL